MMMQGIAKMNVMKSNLKIYKQILKSQKLKKIKGSGQVNHAIVDFFGEVIKGG